MDCLRTMLRYLACFGKGGRLRQPQKAVYDPEGNPCTVEGIGNFGDGTAHTLRKPSVRTGALISHLRRRLQVQDHTGCAADLMDRQDACAGIVGCRMGKNNIHVMLIEKFSGFPSFIFRIHDSEIIHLAPLPKLLSNEAVVPHQAVQKSVKLFPVCVQPCAVQPDPGFLWFFDFCQITHRIEPPYHCILPCLFLFTCQLYSDIIGITSIDIDI